MFFSSDQYCVNFTIVCGQVRHIAENVFLSWSFWRFCLGATTRLICSRPSVARILMVRLLVLVSIGKNPIAADLTILGDFLFYIENGIFFFVLMRNASVGRF